MMQVVFAYTITNLTENCCDTNIDTARVVFPNCPVITKPSLVVGLYQHTVFISKLSVVGLTCIQLQTFDFLCAFLISWLLNIPTSTPVDFCNSFFVPGEHIHRFILNVVYSNVDFVVT